MDYANAGSLFSYVQQRGRLREPLARWYFQQLVLAVDYVHRKVGWVTGVCSEGGGGGVEWG